MCQSSMMRVIPHDLASNGGMALSRRFMVGHGGGGGGVGGE